MVNAVVQEERARFVSGSANRVYASDARITGDRYTSPEFMALEMERLWPRVWNIGGWANEIPEAGDFVTHALGRDSILMVRQGDGSVRAFHNVCPHRGNRLLHVEEGSLERFTCSYHGWTFDHAGSLIHVQDPDDFPQGNPCGKVTLSEIPCEVWAGFIWYNMDVRCAPLGEFMGELKTYYDLHNMGAARRVYYKVCEVDFNWKALHDNFCESYHLPTTHPQINDYYDDDYRNTDFELYETGHNLMKMKGSLPSLRADAPFEMNAKLEFDLETWGLDPADFVGRAHAVRHALQAQKRKLGSAKGFMHFNNLPDAWLTDAFHCNVFPGTSITVLAEVFSLQRCEPHATRPEQVHLRTLAHGAQAQRRRPRAGPGGHGPLGGGAKTGRQVRRRDAQRSGGPGPGTRHRPAAGLPVSGIQGRLPLGPGKPGPAVPQFHRPIHLLVKSDPRPRVVGSQNTRNQEP